MDTDAAAEYLRSFDQGGANLRECFELAQVKAARCYCLSHPHAISCPASAAERVETAGRTLGFI